MAHVRSHGAAEQDAKEYRFEFLVHDFGSHFFDSYLDEPDLLGHWFLRDFDWLLAESPQSAFLYPNGDAMTTTHRGPQPQNGWKVVLNYDPAVVEQMGLGLLERSPCERMMLANSVRAIAKDGSVHFMKDRYGWNV